MARVVPAHDKRSACHPPARRKDAVAVTRVSPAQQMAHMMHIKQEQMGEQEMDNFQDMFNAPNVSSEVRPAHETVSRLCEQPLSSPWASPYRGAERSQEGPEAPDGRKTAPLNSSVRSRSRRCSRARFT